MVSGASWKEKEMWRITPASRSFRARAMGPSGVSRRSTKVLSEMPHMW